MIFHLARRSDGVDGGIRLDPMSLATEGFVHCSTAQQLEATANAYFAGADDLVLVTIDESGLTSELRWEDSHGDGRLFPHLYGPIDGVAVVSVAPWQADADGVFRRSQ